MGIREIKQALSMPVLLRYYGIEVDAHGFALCPFHPEKHKSFKAYSDRFVCFSCNRRGDILDFIQEYENVKDFDIALKKASSIAGLSLSKNSERPLPYGKWRDKVLRLIEHDCFALGERLKSLKDITGHEQELIHWRWLDILWQEIKFARSAAEAFERNNQAIQNYIDKERGWFFET